MTLYLVCTWDTINSQIINLQEKKLSNFNEIEFNEKQQLCHWSNDPKYQCLLLVSNKFVPKQSILKQTWQM